MHYEIAGDAIADLQDLDPAIGEWVLDELEKLIKDRGSVLRRDKAGTCVHDFTVSAPNIVHVVFLRLHLDLVNDRLTLVGIHDFQKAT